MSLIVEVARSSDGRYDVTWHRDISSYYLGRSTTTGTGKSYVITIRRVNQLLRSASANNDDDEQEWTAILVSPASGAIRLDASDVLPVDGGGGGGELLVSVMECTAGQQQRVDGRRYVAECYSIDSVGSASSGEDCDLAVVTSPRRSAVGHNEDQLTNLLSRLRLSAATRSVSRREYASEELPSTSSVTTSGAIPLTFLKARQPSITDYRRYYALSKPASLTLQIEREKFDKATIRWCCDSTVDKWQVTVQKVDANVSLFLSSSRGDVYFIDSGARSLELSQPLTARAKYKVTIKALQRSTSSMTRYVSNLVDNYVTVCQQSKEFLAVLTLTELEQLKQRARLHTAYSSSPCKVLYRNKTPIYFAQVSSYHGGIMKPYIKDNSGDKLSPINGQINGLFFMAETEPGTSGEPCRASAFGSTRLIVPVEVMLELAPKLYFSDFYCMKGINHYVTLVMTKSDSEADRFCSEYLLPLSVDDRSENSFFYRDQVGGAMRVATGAKVEILFTEDVDVEHLQKYRRAEIKKNVQLIGKGHTTPGGVPKRSDCSVCNLYPSGTSAFTQRRRTVTYGGGLYDYDDLFGDLF